MDRGNEGERGVKEREKGNENEKGAGLKRERG